MSLRVIVAVVLWTSVSGASAAAMLGADAQSWRGALFDPRAPPLAAFVLGGALLVAALAGSKAARRIVSDLGAAILGGLAGLGVYTVGYVAAHPPSALEAAAVADAGLAAAGARDALMVAAVSIGALVGFALSRYAWRLYGVASYVALSCIVAGYLLHATTVALPSVPPASLPLSLVLLVAEATSLVMVVVHAFYALDVASRTRWRRHPGRLAFSRHFEPKVAFHVAVYNEPPDIVVASLDSLRALDYPKDRLVVMVLDDSTLESCARPLSEYCRQHGFVYHRRKERRGFKAGALNEGLTITPEDVDLIAVLDADFQVEPRFLRETVGHFIDPRLGFLQTPQDYRNADHSFLTRQYRFADAYFYRAVLPSRNEENAIIFCGTMGILRRQAIVDAGGWGEAFLCEDAELSVRVLDEGYSSVYVNRTYGRGLIPPTFEAYQRQHHRWAYGGGQVLRGHLRRILLGRMSLRQKLDFLVGGVHWFEGIAVAVMAAGLLALGLGDLLGFPVVTHHASDVWLLALVPFLLTVDGVTRLHLAMRRAADVPVTGTLAVLGMWMSVKFNTTWGAVKGAAGTPLVFARTPKSSEGRLPRTVALARAVRLTRWESAAALALALVAGATTWRVYADVAALEPLVPTRALLALWLWFYALLFACAPLYAYKSYTTIRVEEPATAPGARPEAADAALE